MKKYSSTLILLHILFINLAFGGIKKGKGTETPNNTASVFEMRRSYVSNNEFYLTNYGIFGHNTENGGSGWFWPRSSGRAYIFGGGLWFGAKKNITINSKDTLVKGVTVGYNPNSGAGWFGPGSTMDGAEVLNENDSRSAKYILYQSLDYSSDGQNLTNIESPDWPLRWKDLSKTPGKNGYFGDYVSEPEERKQYAPVYISQEDFFCIYKDTDVRRNPEYKPNRIYPLGIEVEQRVFSWDGKENMNIVMMVLDIKNVSGDTLDDCYVGPALDSDIGNAANDYSSYYTKDSTLNLAFQFTGKETGYPGILGFDFMESPRIKTPLDSIRFTAQTGKVRKVGEQIGMTSSRFWTIESDPSSPDDRYAFLASKILEGEKGPTDVRMLMATGPFTLVPGEKVRLVVCVMIAPGVGTPVIGDIQSNGFLDSLILLDKHAQASYDEGTFDSFPRSEIHTIVNGSTAELKIVIDGSAINGAAVTGRVVSPTDSIVGESMLYDDGLHNDSLAGDKIFGGTISIPSQPFGLTLSAVVTESSGKAYEWKRLRNTITTTNVSVGEPVIFADNLNNDGMVNVGEGFRFGIPVKNLSPFRLFGVTMTLTPAGTVASRMMKHDTLDPNGQMFPGYNSGNSGTYFENWIPSGYSSPSLKYHAVITDANENRWQQEFDIAVQPLVQRKSHPLQIAGRTTMKPNILIVDPAKVLDHSYFIHGIDSADASMYSGYSNPGFSIIDSATGNTVVLNTPLNYNTVTGFTVPVTDGFKVVWEGEYTKPLELGTWDITTQDTVKFPWFSYNYNSFASTGNAPVTFWGGPKSNIPIGDYHDVKVRFSKITSFIDINGNGTFDSGDQYFFDTTNTARSQKAYMYRAQNFPLPFNSPWDFVGFKNVPFAAYDVESGVPRQLDIVVTDQDKNGQWDFEAYYTTGSRKFNTIYIMSTTYDPEGKRYDSAKGGLNLCPIFKAKTRMPFYFAMALESDGGPAMSEEGDVILHTTRPLTSRDVFQFNPMTIAGLSAVSNIPEEYSLSQNYPNPFNPVTAIRYSLKQRSNITLKIYNVLGQLVTTLVSASQDAGQYTMQWNGLNTFGQKVSTGMYIYRLEAGTYTAVKKMILIQ